MTGRDRGWRKSSYSMQNGECLELRDAGGAVFVRDSKWGGVAPLAFGSAAWRAFVVLARERA
ncbi:DUF397 domain-containing protein [Streptomyces sp. Z26]|uniref:DUF397 domain-containing protein n=1 Tax=Streptomyces sp. Z26 TaxID=2500177 RepID=UPI000EF16C5B|nr:DUF397 domain-containing protein [Streptomyces sp. Z26]RLL69430.1 DUF397 domain-containing protein [Streptomyces sp. Z26]